jgi:hypothetical protein
MSQAKAAPPLPPCEMPRTMDRCGWGVMSSLGAGVQSPLQPDQEHAAGTRGQSEGHVHASDGMSHSSRLSAPAAAVRLARQAWKVESVAQGPLVVVPGATVSPATLGAQSPTADRVQVTLSHDVRSTPLWARPPQLAVAASAGVPGPGPAVCTHVGAALAEPRHWEFSAWASSHLSGPKRTAGAG